MKRLLFLIVCMGFFITAAALAHKGATGIVKERMDNFKASQMALKQIFIATQRNDLQKVISYAEQIKEWAEQMPDFFPEGSHGAPSEAAPSIWMEFEGFRAAANKHADAAALLIRVAQKGDATTTETAVRKLARTCKSCHQRYRLD